MNFRKIIFPLFMLLFCCLAGCALRTYSNHEQTFTLVDKGTVSAGKSVYICLPEDFRDNGDQVSGSGKKIQTQLGKALEPAAAKRVQAEFVQFPESAFEAAQKAGCDYLLETKILDWQDPPAAFQFKEDKGEITVSVYSVADRSLLRTDALECKGAANTINGIGFFDPAECLGGTMEKWRTQAFR